MKKYLTIIVLIFILKTYAQVGINTTSPDPNAILDINATDKGFSIPTFSITNRNDTSFLAAPPKESLMVYNTNDDPSMTGGKGLYFWSGNKWDFVFNDLNSTLFENLVKYSSAVTNTTNVYSSNNYSQTTYNKGAVLNSDWIVLNDLTQDIIVSRATNDATFILSGMLHANNSSNQTGVYLLTVGIFIDDKLADVKPIYFNASLTCGYKSIKILASSKNLTVGNHTIKFAIKNYSRSTTGTAPTIFYGSTASGCTNLSAEEAKMSSVIILNQPLVL